MDKRFNLEKKLFIPALLTIFFVFYFTSCLYAAEKVVMKVVLNTEEKGEFFVLMTSEKDILVSPDDLREWGFKDVPSVAKIGTEGYISLKSLAPKVTFEIDEKESALLISADPKLLRKNVVDLAYKRPTNVYYIKDNAAFLNYAIDYSMGDDFNFTSLSIPLEFGISGYRYLGFSSFSYTKTEADNRFVRLLSNITKDDPETLRRVVLGDFSAISGPLGGGAMLGGLSVSKIFTFDPYLIRFPALNASGFLNTPSDVSLYVDGMMIKSDHLPSGEFEFMNLLTVQGGGDMLLVIKDAFGHEEKIIMPFYVSSSLLKPGLHEYSYNLGLERKDLGIKSFRYDDFTLAGFHRFGFSETFTGGITAEADKDLVNIGTTANLLLWNNAEADASVALSHADGKFGYGALLNYFSIQKFFNYRFRLETFSRDYANLSLEPSGDKPRFEWSIGFGINQKSLGSLSLSYTSSDFYTEADRKSASVFYSRKLTKIASMFASANWTKSDEDNFEVFFGVNIFLGKERFASMDYAMSDGKSTERLSFQQNPPLGTGFGYRVSAEAVGDDQDSQEFGGNASIQYRNPWGIYSTDYKRISGQNSYNLNASGGVVFIDRSLYLTRPITDSFALVKLSDLGGVRVNYSNQEVGRTNSKGEILVSNLISYTDNSISIEDQDIPVNYQISEIRKYVSTTIRGGGIVKFDITKLQSFVGRLFVIAEGEKKAAEYWGLEMNVRDKAVEAVIGKGGEFYMENIPSGKFPARIFLKDKECKFDMIIPESEDIQVDLGEIACEIH